MYYLLFALVAAFLIVIGYLFTKLGTKNSLKKFVTFISVIFFVSFFFRVFHRDEYYYIFNLLNVKEMFESFLARDLYTNKYTYILIYVLRMFVQASALGIIAQMFNKNQKHLKLFNVCFSLPVYLIALVFIKQYSLSIVGKEYDVLRTMAIALEIGSALTISLLDLIDIKTEKIEFSKRDIKRVIWSIPAFAFLVLYNTTFQNLIGNQIGQYKLFTSVHLILALSPVVILIPCKLILRKRNQDERNYILFLLATGLFIKHFYLYPLDYIYTLPLNLCHFGICMIFLSALLKNRYIATFTLFNSVIGAIIALVLPLGAGEGYLTSAGGYHFLMDHAWLLIIPHLVFRYGNYRKPTIKDVFKLLPLNFLYWFLVCIGQICVQVKYDFVSFLFMNESTLTNLFPFLNNIKNNFIISFECSNGNTIYIYYLYWVVILVALNLISFTGFGIWKLLNLRANKVKNIK